VNLANYDRFTKLKSSKLLHYTIIIINSQRCSPNFPLPNLLRTEFAKTFRNSTKLSCYMIHHDCTYSTSVDKHVSMYNIALAIYRLLDEIADQYKI